MPLDTPPPADILSIARAATGGGYVRYAVCSDLDRAGRLAPCWVTLVDQLAATAAYEGPAREEPVSIIEPNGSLAAVDDDSADAGDDDYDDDFADGGGGDVTNDDVEPAPLPECRLVVVEDGKAVVNLALAEVEEIRVEERLGGGSLLARLRARAGRETGRDAEGGPVPPEKRLAWFTKNPAPEMGVFARVANDIREGRKAELPEPEGAAVCPKCGRPLQERGGNCPHCVNVLRVFARLLGFMKAYRWRMAALVAATIAGVLLQVMTPYFTMRITDDIIVPRATRGLWLWIGLMLLAATGIMLARWYATYLSSWLAARVIADLRTRLHAHMQRLRLGYFHKREAGELTSRVMHDTEELQQFLIDGLPYLVVNTLLFAAIAAILVSLDPWLSICAFIPVPVMLYGIHWIWIRLHSLFHKDGSLHGRLYSVLGESLRGVKAVKAASREDQRSETFGRINQSIVDTVVRIDRRYAAFSEGTSWIFAVAEAAVWLFAAWQIASLPAGGAAPENSTLTMGGLVAYVIYIRMFYGPLSWFSVISNWMNHALASAERIFAVLDTPEEIYDAPGAVDPARFRGHVEFRHVRFSYDRGKEVIKDISLDIAPGRMVGLVGKSGAGKSTMVNLLCRFYDVDSGEIRIDGQPLKNFRLDGLRHQIGFVMQEPFLFRASLLENIRYGSPGASFAEVVRAAKAAYAHDFIVDKEFGYDTIVGDGGAELSGGEKQRIAIARALLHDPPLLILDEATSSVDSETEKRIQEALATLVKGRTVIAIAHRLATLRNADLLVVLDEGKVVEQGGHDELMRAGGIYAGLVKTQTELNRLRDESQAL